MLPLPFRFCVAQKQTLADGSLDSVQSVSVAILQKHIEFVNAHISYTVVHCPKEPFRVKAYAPDIDGQFSSLAFCLTITPDQVFICESHPLAQLHFNHEKAEQVAVVLAKNPVHRPTALPTQIAEKYCHRATMLLLSEEFADSSLLHFPSFFSSETLASMARELESMTFHRVGPVDYRCLDVCLDSSLLTTFFSSPSFVKWLSKTTGLDLLFPQRPVHVRRIASAGDYQILHGNYSEPAGLDIIFNWIPSLPDHSEWPEDCLGRIHYLDEDGVELFQAPQYSNCLVLVYRTAGVERFTENVRGQHNPPLYQVLATFAVADDECDAAT